jgi:hypothetical protein
MAKDEIGILVSGERNGADHEMPAKGRPGRASNPLADSRHRSPLSVATAPEPDQLLPLNEEQLVRRPAPLDAFHLDEIGKIECRCLQFVATIRRLLSEPIRVVATIALRGGGLIAEVNIRPDVQVVKVTYENRQMLPGEIAAWVKGGTAHTNTR